MAKATGLTTRSAVGRAPLSTAGAQMPPRTSGWGRDAALLVAAGLAAFAALPLLHHRHWAIPASAAVLALAAARVLYGRRAVARCELIDRLTEALAPELGLKIPTRRAVHARSWTRGWPGAPRRITLRYAPDLNDADPAWRLELVAVVERRLLAGYRVARHDMRDKHRCRLHLTLTPSSDTPAESPPAVLSRAQRAAGELFGATATVHDPVWSTDGELVGFTVAHTAGAKLAASGYRRRIEQVVSTMLPGRWRASWDLEADTARFEVRPSFPENIWLPVRKIDPCVDVLASYDSVEIHYGQDEDGQIMVWRPAHDPNVMAVGAPGSGKTVFDHTILVEVTRHGWPVWVVDGKAIEFLGFQDWPNVQVVATTIEEQVAVIHRAWEVMEHRYSLITSGRAKESDFEPLLVFLDEFADFRSNLMAWYIGIKVKGDPTKPVVLSRVASIARKGRTSRVHLTFTTQRPDAEYFGGDMRDNFRMRVSMGRLSPQGAMMMWESPAIGTSIPRGCRGRATTISDANRAVEVQTYRTPDPRKTTPGSPEDELLQQLRPAAARHERLLILPPDVSVDLDTGDPSSATYSDFAATRWVLASTRPDLDPVVHRQKYVPGGRELASPMTVFGLRSPSPADDDMPALAVDAAPTAQPAPRRVAADWDVSNDLDPEEFFGYGAVGSGPPSRLSVGDLILVDEENGQWGVVDAEPETDYAEPGCVAVSWRGDDDESGALSIPEDTAIAVRRPLESEE